MTKKLIVLLFFCRVINVYSQEIYNPIDSTLGSFRLADQDWIISLSIDLAGIRYDPQGNTMDGDPNGTFIMRKTNGRVYLQRLKVDYGEERPVLKTGNILNISDSVICLYTIDSICKSGSEYIYPYIYKNDSLGVYQTQGQSDHSPYYELRMKTNQCEYRQKFMEIEMYTSPIYFEIYRTVPMNLNAGHNMNTFVYRSFINFCKLLKKQYQLLILQ
jgi:hypothetical protein